MADKVALCAVKATEHDEEGNSLILSGTTHLSSITGSSDPEFSEYLLTTLTRSLPSSQQTLRDDVNAAIQAIHSMNPRDSIEGMLCSQIVTLFAQGMHFLQRAQTALPEHAGYYYNISSKSLKLQHEAIEKLERYRRKGKQQMHIEHVHIHEGGQAVIGTLSKGA